MSIQILDADNNNILDADGNCIVDADGDVTCLGGGGGNQVLLGQACLWSFDEIDYSDADGCITCRLP